MCRWRPLNFWFYFLFSAIFFRAGLDFSQFVYCWRWVLIFKIVLRKIRSELSLKYEKICWLVFLHWFVMEDIQPKVKILSLIYFQLRNFYQIAAVLFVHFVVYLCCVSVLAIFIKFFLFILPCFVLAWKSRDLQVKWPETWRSRLCHFFLLYFLSLDLFYLHFYRFIC